MQFVSVLSLTWHQMIYGILFLSFGIVSVYLNFTVPPGS